MLLAIEAIRSYTETMDFDAFIGDRKTVDAVVRRLEILGEAACHVPDSITAACPELDWQRMRGIRNVIAHEYFGISDAIIWETVKTDLPGLVGSLQSLLFQGKDANDQSGKQE
jgi:uncharacterized protein with HEPN domain